MESWVFDLPQTTPMSLNARMNWAVAAKMKKPYREAAHVLALQQKIPACKRVRVTLIYTPKDKRRRDPLNLVATLKLVEDGLVDAGVIPDDTPDYLESQLHVIALAIAHQDENLLEAGTLELAYLASPSRRWPRWLSPSSRRSAPSK
jgi:crossover junction endodeoxyribonuclease RusA